jgi:NAD(P)-dependent dehydrogenase (short-subunit alcohol dehydrogenase family)
MELKGKCAIVTGSTGKLGGELTAVLARAGCDCVCHYYRNEEKALQLVGEIESLGRKAVAVRAELTGQGEIEKVFDKAESLGSPSILVNSAAVFPRTPLEQISFEQIRGVLDLNLATCIMTAKEFAKRISKEGDSDEPAGKIINVSDVAAISPWAEYSVYCASKAGLTGATKALAKELAPDILVNALSPGVMTQPGEMTGEEEKRQLSFIPMKRFAEADEITAAFIYLLKNDYVTGQVLNVSGGRVI